MVCPRGMREIGGNCYWNTGEVTADFATSEKICSDLGLEILSGETNPESGLEALFEEEQLQEVRLVQPPVTLIILLPNVLGLLWN